MEGNIRIERGIVIRGDNIADKIIITKNKEIMVRPPGEGLVEDELRPLLNENWVSEMSQMESLEEDYWDFVEGRDSITLLEEPQLGENPAERQADVPEKSKKKDKRSGRKRIRERKNGNNSVVKKNTN